MSCGALIQQAAFLSNVVVVSNHLLTDSAYLSEWDKEDSSGIDRTNHDDILRAEETQLWVQRLQKVHMESLIDVLSTSALVDHEMHVGLSLPTKVAKFLGRVMSKIIFISKSVTAPPLALHINPHSPSLPFPHDTALVSGDTHKVAKLKLIHRQQLASGVARAGLSAFITDNFEDEDTYFTKQSHSKSHTLWAHTLPPTSFPQRIDVVVYVVSMQNSYPALAHEAREGETGLNFQQIVRGLRQLKLRNQEMSVSLRRINSLPSEGVDDGSNSIHMGMDTCLRSTRDLQKYLDASCFWALLRSKDANVGHTGDDKQQRPWLAANQHVPIFVLSVDEAYPLFVSPEKKIAIVSGDGVLAVQNKQRDIFTGNHCGGRDVVLDGRNPTGAALVAAAQAIAGLSVERSSCSHSASSFYDALMGQYENENENENENSDVSVQHIFGSSVTFINTADADMGGINFSEMAVVGAHRARIIHAAGYSAELLKESVAATQEGTRERSRAIAVRAFFSAVIGKVLHDLDAVDYDSLHMIAAQVNTVYHLTEEWVNSQTLPPKVLRIIAQKLGNGDFLDGDTSKNFSEGVGAAEVSENIFLIIGYRNVVIFLVIALATFVWPSKSKRRVL